jgi:hypothetical protein
MRGKRLSAGLAMALLIALAGPASALVSSVTILPSSQSGTGGNTISWTGSWSGGTAPFGYTFFYGDGASTSGSTSSHSKGFSHKFFPCSPTTYTQTLRVSDADGPTQDTSTTTVAPGPVC